jgi:NACalpha-BTF3-like transcription factor
MPRRRDVQLVMDEAEVSREDAVAALKRHEGNLVDALEELM